MLNALTSGKYKTLIKKAERAQEEGKLQQACDTYEAALRCRNVQPIDAMKVLNTVGTLLSQQEKHEQAIEKYAAALELRSDDIRAADRSRALYNKALSLAALNRHALAIRCFDESSKYVGRNHNFLEAFAASYIAQGEHEKGAEELEKALAINMSCEKCLLSITEVLEDCGQYQQALGYYLQYFEKFSASKEAFVAANSRAYVYLYAEDHLNAHNAFEKLASKNAKSSSPIAGRGYVALCRGQIDKARQLFAKALEVKYSQYAQQGKLIVESLGEENIAENLFDELDKETQDWPLVYRSRFLFLRAYIYYKTGNIHYARLLSEKFRKINESYPAMQKLRVEIRKAVGSQGELSRSSTAELSSSHDSTGTSRDVIQINNRYKFDSHIAQLLEQLAIPKMQLSYAEKLGGGGFGVVYKGEWHNDPVAIKRLKPELMDNQQNYEEFVKEASIMFKLRNPRIVRFFGITDTYPCEVVMEYMPYGSLRDVLKRNKRGDISWSVKLIYATDVASGLSYLHGLTHPLIHCDLKSLNVLVDAQNRVKLTDFGLSKLKRRQGDSTVSNANSDSVLGTPQWAAPELINEKPNTPMTDMYAFGVVMWEISSHKLPYEGLNLGIVRLGAKILDGMREQFIGDEPKGYQVLAEQCWLQEPSERKSAKECLEILKEMQVPPAPQTSTISPLYEGSTPMGGVGKALSYQASTLSSGGHLGSGPYQGSTPASAGLYQGSTPSPGGK